MQVARKVTAGAVAALALTGSGCAGFIEQLQAMQAQQQGGIQNASGVKANQAGIAAVAASSQDAIKLAEIGDAFRDGMPRADYISAHDAYKRALELEPRNTYVLVAKATAYLREGLEVKFSNPDGSATTDANKLRKAETLLKRSGKLAEKALEVNASYGTAHFIVGEMYALLGDHDKAIETFDRIEKQNIIPTGHKSTFFAWRGFVKKVKGDEAGAKADLENAVENAEPLEFSEYADRVLNPPTGPEANKQPDGYRAVVPAL